MIVRRPLRGSIRIWGRGARLPGQGVAPDVAFQVGLAPLLSWYELGNVPLVALALVLLARDYDRSLLDVVRGGE